MASSASAQEGLAALMRLYRQVLRVHRAKLPPPLRSLGDSYVKSELRRHLSAKTSPTQWREFGDQWSAYVSMLSGRADADEARGATRPLHDADGQLNEEQQEQLRRLREAALELGGGPGGGGGADGGGGGCGGGGGVRA